MKLPVAALLAISAVFAGQSLVTTDSLAYTNSIPPQPHGSPIRLEMAIHDWTDGISINQFLSDSVGLQVQVANSGSGNIILSIYSLFDTLNSVSPAQLPLTGISPRVAYIRVQRDVVAGQFEVEAWDSSGVRFYTYSTALGGNRVDSSQGLSVGAPGGIGTAFCRVHTTVVPMNSRPPVTADNADTLVHWKFDGSLDDSSGNGYFGTIFPAGSPVYVSTPYQNVVAKIKTMGSPSYSDWAALRVGYSNQLDGSSSYSQADSSAAVTYAWSQTAGATLTWNSHTTVSPSVTPPSFGQYTLALTATDTESNTGATTLVVGAVVTDDNWVVQPTDLNVTTIFGPMIAWGHSPWGYMDERAMRATTLRMAAYTDGSWINGVTKDATKTINPPGWQTTQAGTVDYIFGGQTAANGTGQTLCAAITSTSSLSVTLCGTTGLDVASFPTRILVGSYPTAEEMRVTSILGNILTIATGGRGSGGTTAQTWPNGTPVSELKVTGTATSFLSTACSGDATKSLSLHYTRPDGSDGQIIWPVTGCESNTRMFVNFAHDISILNGTTQTSKQYSWFTSLPSYAGANGANFYGEDLAHRALYYRSGLAAARTAANLMSGQYVSSPYLAGGDGIGVSPLVYGGGVIGAIAAALLDPGVVAWGDLRAFATAALPVADVATWQGQCNNSYDSRDSGYALAILALMAQFDPDAASKSIWLAGVKQSYSKEQACKRSDNSWANAAGKFNVAAYPALTVTNGSTAVTGSGFVPAMCAGISAGAATVTAGSAAVGGTGFVNQAGSGKIAITGTRGGVSFTGWYRYQYNSPTSITLGVLWPGDSGTGSHVTENDDPLTGIGANFDDPRLQQNWSCTYGDSGHLVLNRPWVGAGTETVGLFRSNLPGYAQQAYMLGIKIHQLMWAALVDSTHDWTGMANAAANWVQSTGYDPWTQGLDYGRVMQACEPQTTPTPGTLWDVRTPGCNQGLLPSGIKASRVLTAEGTQALSQYYAEIPTGPARIWGDTAYGSVWGNPAYTTGGVYADAIYVTDENNDASLSGPKWTGYFFGMGMSHQWPAARLSGGAPVTGLPIFGGKVGIGGKVMVN